MKRRNKIARIEMQGESDGTVTTVVKYRGNILYRLFGIRDNSGAVENLQHRRNARQAEQWARENGFTGVKYE